MQSFFYKNGVVMEISIKDLQKKSIFVAANIWWAKSRTLYESMLDLQGLCVQYGINIKFSFLFNESLITRARNYLVDEFLHRSDCTHLLFIDSDIHFKAQDVLACLHLIVMLFVEVTSRSLSNGVQLQKH
jgi:hypothetical protein